MCERFKKKRTKREVRINYPKVDKKGNWASNEKQTTLVKNLGEMRVCLGVTPGRMRICRGAHEVETYPLLDSGSEVALCHERLVATFNFGVGTFKFTLTGMNRSEIVEIHVESLDGSTAVELSNVKTVKQMLCQRDVYRRN